MKGPNGSLALLSALGESWRGDWGDFDGRVLRAQLDGIADLIRRECSGEDVRGPLAAEYAVLGVCPRCRSWTEHCRCGGAA